MSLEVHIYGPGFGETIFLRWQREDGGWTGALVDACSPQRGKWLADKLVELEIKDLELAIATHPHLDHIRCLAEGLERAEIHPRRSCYWPGLSPGYWMEFFNTLAATRGGELPKTASMICRWFNFASKGIKERGFPAFDVGGQATLDTFFELKLGGKPLRFTAIGPWLHGMNRLVRNVSACVENTGGVDYEHRHANDVSIAILVEYGESQIVLGGDMEAVNWSQLSNLPGRPRFRPSLVKVSHHGSATGRIEGMWHAKGFFDGRGSRPIAVVTPWMQAGQKLPSDNCVLNEIRDAGFSVYVTGQGSHRYRNPDSHVTVIVQPDGSTSTNHTQDVRVMKR